MEVVASLSQGRTAAPQCGLFTHKSVPVIFEPPCMNSSKPEQLTSNCRSVSGHWDTRYLELMPMEYHMWSNIHVRYSVPELCSSYTH